MKAALLLILAGTATVSLKAECAFGQGRPATPAEQEFEARTKQALRKALAGSAPAGWQMTSSSGTRASPIQCASSTQPVQTTYRVSYENTAKTEAFVRQLTANPQPNSWQTRKLLEESRRDGQVSISVAVNNSYCGMNGVGLERINVPGVKLAVRSNDTSGAVGGSAKATLLCIGNWQEPHSTPSSLSTEMTFLRAAPATSVQTLTIRIEAEPPRADQILKSINLAQIRALLE